MTHFQQQGPHPSPVAYPFAGAPIEYDCFSTSVGQYQCYKRPGQAASGDSQPVRSPKVDRECHSKAERQQPRVAHVSVVVPWANVPSSVPQTQQAPPPSAAAARPPLPLPLGNLPDGMYSFKKDPHTGHMTMHRAD